MVNDAADDSARPLALSGGGFTLTCVFARSPGRRFTHDEIRDSLMSRM